MDARRTSDAREYSWPFSTPKPSSGVSVVQFLRQAIAARKGLEELSVLEVRLDLMEWMDRLGMDPAFAERHLNDGFSGGERKRNEVLQMALLAPTLALLDETDSGLGHRRPSYRGARRAHRA